MKKYSVVAEGKQTSWTVVYKVNEVLKGEHSAETVTVKLNSESFKKPAKSGGAGIDGDSLLILFLAKDKEHSFQYAGPPLNSPDIAASEANVAAVKAIITQQEISVFSWYEVSPTGVLLVVMFIVVVLILALLVRKRRRVGSREPENGGL